MQTDPQLSLFVRAPADANVQWLEHWLQASGKWWTAAQLSAQVQGRLNERDLRALASASEWILSGQQGYKHLDHATAEEIDHAAGWLERQAKKMGERAGRLRAAGHKRIG